MKIYIAKRNTLPGELGWLYSFKQGDFACEADAFNNYATKGYPLSYDIIQKMPELFEFWKEDNDHNPSYYINPFYTQYEMDRIMEHIGQPPFISHLKQ